LEILAKRQETDPGLTIEEMFRREAVYALGLTREQMALANRAKTKDKLEKLSDADLQEIQDIIDSKTPPEPEPEQLPV